jgi:hypothetical protein
LAYVPNGSSSYDDAAVNAGTQYFYRLTAINGPSSSPHSATTTVQFPGFVRGDFNLDGHLNSADIQPMLAALIDLNSYQSAHNLSTTDLAAIGDVNLDGQLNNADVQALLSLLIGGGGSAESASKSSEVPAALVVSPRTPIFWTLATGGDLTGNQHHEKPLPMRCDESNHHFVVPTKASITATDEFYKRFVFERLAITRRTIHFGTRDAAHDDLIDDL